MANVWVRWLHKTDEDGRPLNVPDVPKGIAFGVQQCPVAKDRASPNYGKLMSEYVLVAVRDEDAAKVTGAIPADKVPPFDRALQRVWELGGRPDTIILAVRDNKDSILAPTTGRSALAATTGKPALARLLLHLVHRHRCGKLGIAATQAQALAAEFGVENEDVSSEVV